MKDVNLLEYEVYCWRCGNVDYKGKGLIWVGTGRVYCQSCKKTVEAKVRRKMK